MEKNQDLSSGKTCRGPSPPTKGRTSKPSSKRSSGSKNRKRHRCLRLKKADGPTPTVTWETDGAWHTAFLTLGTGASPNEGQESFLSQILQADVPQRFYLSRKACLGILRRASARGKALPEILKKALEQQEERMREDRGRVILNDQGGSRIDVSEDVVSTLRAEAHHPPVLLDEHPAAAGFCTEHSANARGIGYGEETSPTLRAGVVPAAIALDYHPADSRIGIGEPETIQTLTSRMGTGGNNVPLVMDGKVHQELPPQTLKIRSGCEGGGKGAQVQVEKSATLGCNNDQTVFVPYGICSKASRAMLSENPHTGFYEADTARTLDQNGGRPDCSQGGIAVVAFSQNQRDEVRDLKNVAGALAAEPGTKQQTYVLQGSMIGRADKNGPQGDGVNEDVSFTLDTSDRHAVAYCMTAGEFTRVGNEQSPPIMARDYKDPNVVIKEDNGRDADQEPAGDRLAEGRPLCMATGQANAEIGEDLCPTLSCNHEAPIITEPYYIVRRLTPTECARLQGFPDAWCADLGTAEPTDAEIAFWEDVFETHRKAATGAKKPKTEKQIRKWLANPYSDSAEYRLWGNGIALPCAYFVLSGIVWAAGLDGTK